MSEHSLGSFDGFADDVTILISKPQYFSIVGNIEASPLIAVEWLFIAVDE